MKWVPTKPFVESPQTKNEKVKNQKSRFFDARRKTSIASFAAFRFTCTGATQSAGAPYGEVPIDAGLSLSRKKTNGTMVSDVQQMVMPTDFQPW